VLDLDEPVRPDLVELLDMLLLGIGNRDTQDLEIVAFLVAHFEATDRSGGHVATGERRLVDQ
jgi:hypothetical protein